MAWKDDVVFTIKSYSKNHIDALVKESRVDREWRFTGFYGVPFVNDRNRTWNLLFHLGQTHNNSWLLCGDFNEILFSFKKG